MIDGTTGYALFNTPGMLDDARRFRRLTDRP
jgi:hypothetical protein